MGGATKNFCLRWTSFSSVDRYCMISLIDVDFVEDGIPRLLPYAHGQPNDGYILYMQACMIRGCILPNELNLSEHVRTVSVTIHMTNYIDRYLLARPA